MPGPAARESYLVIHKIITVAKETGADAIHPGYGFLSENTELAAACEQAGIIFVGPNARAIEVMGDKAAARQLMADSGVPVLPGFDEDGASDELLAASDSVGFPLLIKAVAGGGGKGMRVVNSANAFAESLAAARREARSAFGDDRVLLESVTCPPPAMWKCRFSQTITAMRYTCSSAIARCSVATRRSLRKPRHRVWMNRPARRSATLPFRPPWPLITAAPARWSFIRS